MASFNAPMDDKVPKGATKVAIRPAQGPALGQFEPVGKPPVVPQPIQQAPAQISEPQGMPKGAQPVPLVQPGPQLAAAQPVPGPAIPQRSPFMAAPQAAIPQALPQTQPRRFQTDVHTIEVVAQGPDGREYSASYEVEVPAGSKLLGVRSYLNQP